MEKKRSFFFYPLHLHKINNFFFSLLSSLCNACGLRYSRSQKKSLTIKKSKAPDL